MAALAASVACSKNDAGAIGDGDAHDQAARQIRSEDGGAPSQSPQIQQPNAAPQRPANGPARALPPGAIEVQVSEITDPGGFGRPMVAARALVPPGWRTQGGVQWAQDIACNDPATFNWAAVAPDGVTRIELIPTEGWQHSSTPMKLDCQPGDFQDIRSYLTAYVERRYPGAQPLDYRSRPDFLEAQKEYLQAKIAMINNSGVGMRAWADAGELLYAHRENGVDMRGVVAASGMFYGSQLANPMGGPPLTTITGATNATFAARAPNGQLDFQKIEAIRKSVKLDPAWALEMFKHTAKLGDINVRGVKERAAIIVAGGAAMTQATIEANQMATQGYADRMATDDRIQRERIEAIRGVETYSDPLYGGTVQLDATYDHAWRVQTSESYILTNDPNFNPGQYGIEARQLPVVQ